ncbi:hypothetical protein ACFX11_033434 [Malus domestica]
MAIWFRILGVPIEYFNVWAMRKIGCVLGKLLKIDVNTNPQYRGKFARICVEIDATEPLEAFIQINKGRYDLEYEGMPEICFRCGCYGHKRESYPWSIDPMAEKVDGGENESNSMNIDEPIVKSAQSSDDVFTIHGTWMQGSRFSALNGEDKSLNEGNVGSGINGEKGEGLLKGKFGWLGRRRKLTDMYYGSNMSKGTCIFGHQPSNASGNGVELATCDLDPSEKMMNTNHAILVWNSRGAGCIKFKHNVAELINIHQMEILVICEPMISGQKAISVVKSLGFPCFEIMDVVGFSGGLWMLWKDSRLKVEVISTIDQAISVAVRGVADCHQLPWSIVGDFNMLCVEDKLGGALLC